MNASRSSGFVSTFSEGEIKDILMSAIQLSNANKITIENTWNIKLLNVLDKAVEGSSFQENSITLDTATKIYTKRVDSVHNEAVKILSLMAEQRKKRKEKKKQDEKGEGIDKKEKKKRRMCVNTLVHNEKEITRNEREFQKQLFDPFLSNATIKSRGSTVQYDLGDPQSLLSNHLLLSDRACLMLDLDKHQHTYFKKLHDRKMRLIQEHLASAGKRSRRTTQTNNSSSSIQSPLSPTIPSSPLSPSSPSSNIDDLIHTPPRQIMNIYNGKNESLGIDKRFIPQTLPRTSIKRHLEDNNIDFQDTSKNLNFSTTDSSNLETNDPIKDTTSLMNDEFDDHLGGGGGGDGGGDLFDDDQQQQQQSEQVVEGLFDLDVSEFDQEDDNDDRHNIDGATEGMMLDGGNNEGGKEMYHEDEKLMKKELQPNATLETIDLENDYAYFNDRASFITENNNGDMNSGGGGGGQQQIGGVKYDWTGLNRFRIVDDKKKGKKKNKNDGKKKRKKKIVKVRFRMNRIKIEDFQQDSEKTIRKLKKSEKELINRNKIPEDHHYQVSDFHCRYNFELPLPGVVIREKLKEEERLRGGTGKAVGEEGREQFDGATEGDFYGDDLGAGGGGDGGGDLMDDLSPDSLGRTNNSSNVDLPNEIWEADGEIREPMAKRRRLTIQGFQNPESLMEEHEEGIEEIIEKITDNAVGNSQFLFHDRVKKFRMEGMYRKPKHLLRVENRQKVDVGLLKDVMWGMIQNEETINFVKLMTQLRENDQTKEATVSESFISVLHLANEKEYEIDNKIMTDFTIQNIPKRESMEEEEEEEEESNNQQGVMMDDDI